MNKGSGLISTILVVLIIVITVIVFIKSLEAPLETTTNSDGEKTLVPIDGANKAKDLIESRNADAVREF